MIVELIVAQKPAPLARLGAHLEGGEQRHRDWLRVTGGRRVLLDPGVRHVSTLSHSGNDGAVEAQRAHRSEKVAGRREAVAFGVERSQQLAELLAVLEALKQQRQPALASLCLLFALQLIQRLQLLDVGRWTAQPPGEQVDSLRRGRGSTAESVSS